MDDYLNNVQENKSRKKNQLSEELSHNIVNKTQIYEADIPGYLDDFLQNSKKTVFIIGNNVNIINPPTKKRIIKKKKIKKGKKINYNRTEKEKKNEIDIEENKNKIFSKKEQIKEHLLKDLEMSEDETYISEVNKDSKQKNKLKEKLDDFENEQKLSAYKKFYHFYKSIFLHLIKDIFKSIYLFIKMKNLMNSSATKIGKYYRRYISSRKLRLNYMIYKIINTREQNIKKISLRIKLYLYRKEVKKLLEKKENNLIIYSSINIDKNEILYFKYIHKNGKEKNFYFEYSFILKCFIFFVNKNDDRYLKIIQGNFFDSKSNKLVDKNFEINNKGENIINIPKIFQNCEIISEKNDRIINRYLKIHKSKKRMTIDEYEDSKKKSKDDYNLKNNSKSKKLTKLRCEARSKSFIRIKGETITKSILKPSRSYVNLKNAEKKIHFGKAKIRKYKNKKE